MNEKAFMKNMLLDYENDIKYCEGVLSSDAPEESKKDARARLQRAKAGITALKKELEK